MYVSTGGKQLKKLLSKFRYLDYHICIPFLFLSIIGIVMVYSSSSYSAMRKFNNAEYYFIRQLVFFTLGLVLFTITYLFPMGFFKKQGPLMIFVLSLVVLLIGLLLFGKEVNGSKGWIDLKRIGLPFKLQPAEFAKLVVIWYFAFVFSKKQEQILSSFIKTILRPTLLVGLMIGLIFIQPDVGASMIIFLTAAVMIFSSGMSPKLSFFFTGIGLAVLSGFSWVLRNHRNWVFFMKDYQYNRFLAYWNPFELAQSTGMQLVNSYYALSRGGLFGVGIGESVQKTGYLPEPHTDFIMSILGEELGLIGILIVLGIFIYLIMRIYLIAIRSKDSFYSLFCIGIATMMLIQASINLGGVLGLMPITGVTFPFISYGGSSTMILAIAMGIVANISTLERKKLEQIEMRDKTQQ